MKNLKNLESEKNRLKQLINLYEELAKLTPLTTEQKEKYDEAKKDLSSISFTIDNLTSEIEYTEEEKSVFLLPQSEQENTWFKLLEKSDFSKDCILRICSMLQADGVIPFFKKDGIKISKQTANKAYKLICDHGFNCLNATTKENLFKTKEKIKNGITLNKNEIIYKEFLDNYDECEDDSISGKCVFKTYEYFTSLLCDKYKKTGNIEDRCDYLLDRVIMALSFGGELASGEKEFILSYFKEKKKLHK